MQETQMECRFVESWHDHPELIGAFAEKLKDGWTVACEQLGANAPVIFTAHSVPARTIHDGDPYEAQARATAQLVRQRLPELAAADVKFAFQSQGMSGEPWIEPTVEETILELKNAGHRGVVIQPIGFLCDHVEILYDIDIAFKKFAQQQGMRLWRTQSLNDSPHLIRALADLAQESQHAKASATRPLRS
jgi:ferrochelatase